MHPVIQKFKLKHGDTYDYSQVNYLKAKTKVIVICKEHGEFLITPNNHLSGHGCPKCKGQGFTPQENLQRFLNDAYSIHGNKYDYSSVDITDKKLTIICSEHGPFKQSKLNHITGKNGCPSCGKEKAKKSMWLDKEKFFEKSIKTHGNKYSYDNVDYRGAHTKVSITCPDHGDFQITPANHWSNGVGCPSCFNSNPSKGESKIYHWLLENGIEFKSQKSFPDLYYRSNKGRLRYDFYINSLNLLIEYDGEYHYNPISFNKHISPEEQLKITQIRDRIKTEYASNNGYNLLRIRYDEDIYPLLEKSCFANKTLDD